MLPFRGLLARGPWYVIYISGGLLTLLCSPVIDQIWRLWPAVLLHTAFAAGKLSGEPEESAIGLVAGY